MELEDNELEDARDESAGEVGADELVCLPDDWVYSLNKEADKSVEHEEDIQSTQARTDIAT